MTNESALQCTGIKQKLAVTVWPLSDSGCTLFHSTSHMNAPT